jgi:hypothetical protein
MKDERFMLHGSITLQIQVFCIHSNLITSFLQVCPSSHSSKKHTLTYSGSTNRFFNNKTVKGALPICYKVCYMRPLHCFKECTLSSRTLLWHQQPRRRACHNIVVHGSVLGSVWVSSFEHTSSGTRIWSFLKKLHTRSLYWIF